ncbi:MAG: HEAT repeat domain-containing protein [Planctomyces sp.]|nr:HEAT repeat domain-containing protein [Planctomyces sp.]
MRISPRWLLTIAFALPLFGGGGTARAADPAQVQQAIARGANWLRGNLSKAVGGKRWIMALAAMKGGVSANDPEIRNTINEVLKRVNEAGEYSPDPDHYYSAGVAAVLLADADPEQYRPALDALAAYLIAGQRENGSWDYPTPRGTDGDTSVSHYALLGLWACARAECSVPGEVWEKAIQWHVRQQNSDGGFAYTPGFDTDQKGGGRAASMPNMAINAVGSIAIAWININPNTPPSLDADPPKLRTAASASTPKNNDALEAVPLAEPVLATSGSGAVPDGAANTMRRAFNWYANRYSIENKTTSHNSYYYYSLERMAAMINVTKIDGHDWYAEVSDYLLTKQTPEGSWNMGSFDGEELDTTFALLSLVRSTAKLMKRSDGTPTFGQGLLVGGRGLPENLQDGLGQKKKERKNTPLDDLLKSLASATDLDVEDVQEELIEQVQIGNREELVRQKDLLVKLVRHPNAEVRRTAAWALGRTNDIGLAQHLITALQDSDVGVNVEAHNALCWISRKSLGFDLSLDPLEGLPLDAGPDVKDAAVKAWRSEALKNWGSWYLANRPYRERGDEFEAQLREKLATLN